MQQLHVAFSYVAGSESLLHHVVVVGEGLQFYASVGKRFGSNGEAIGLACHHAYHLVACLTQRLDSLQAAATGRDEVFYHHHL